MKATCTLYESNGPFAHFGSKHWKRVIGARSGFGYDPALVVVPGYVHPGTDEYRLYTVVPTFVDKTEFGS
jgi:hypothetical protein